mgnify:CR=1 FL=1
MDVFFLASLAPSIYRGDPRLRFFGRPAIWLLNDLQPACRDQVRPGPPCQDSSYSEDLDMFQDDLRLAMTLERWVSILSRQEAAGEVEAVFKFLGLV